MRLGWKALLGAAVVLCWCGAAASAAPLFVFAFSGRASQPGPQLILNGSPLAATTGYPTTANTGWWDSTGFHDPTNPNYAIGMAAGVGYRDYFVFDLSAVQTPITSAVLAVYNPGPADNPAHGDGFHGAASATVSVFDVSTSLAELESSGASDVGVFDDLGSGALFGQQTVTAADNGQFVDFVLDPVALAALNGRSGPQFAFGTSITAFRPVPEPVSLALLGTALAGAFAGRRRRPAIATTP